MDVIANDIGGKRGDDPGYVKQTFVVELDKEYKLKPTQQVISIVIREAK